MLTYSQIVEKLIYMWYYKMEISVKVGFHMKKLISILLAIVMVLGCAVPALATAEDNEYPIIYLSGFGSAIYSDNMPNPETQIYPLKMDVMTVVKENIGGILKELPGGFATGNWGVYCDRIYDAFAPMFEEIKLDNNGEASNGSGNAIDIMTKPIPQKTSGYGLWDYQFNYDWRLSPMLVVDDLKNFIERVKIVTGEDKVSLVGRCLGGNVICSYLTKYQSHAQENIDTVMLFTPSTLGLDFFGELFSGKAVFNPNDVDNFVGYALDQWQVFNDPTSRALTQAIISLSNELNTLDIGMDLFQKAFDNIKDNILPRCIRASFGTFSSFWAMVPADYYDAAKAYVFGGLEDEYSGLITKMDDYYYNCQLKITDVLKELETAGVGIGVIGKYNTPNLPVYESAGQQGDLMSDTYNATFGATCAPYGEVLSEEYISTIADKRFLSPDKIIDASTCLFPEKTWFIKDLYHNYFPATVDPLIMSFVHSNGEMTIFDDPQWPQYVSCDRTTYAITPMVTYEEPGFAFGTFKRFLQVLKDLFLIVPEYFKALFANMSAKA